MSSKKKRRKQTKRVVLIVFKFNTIFANSQSVIFTQPTTVFYKTAIYSPLLFYSHSFIYFHCILINIDFDKGHCWQQNNARKSQQKWSEKKKEQHKKTNLHSLKSHWHSYRVILNENKYWKNINKYKMMMIF